MTTPAEISLREQQLDSEGHDSECAAYDDRDCSCHLSGVLQADARPLRKTRRAEPGKQWVTPIGAVPAVELTGRHAEAYAELCAAHRELATAKQMFAAASQRAQGAYEAFLALSVGPAPP